MLDADQEIEAALGVIVRIGIDQHKGRSTAGVDVPWFRAREVVGELEVEAGHGEIVAKTELDVRTERDVFGEWLGFDLPADHELIGIHGRPGPDAERLRVNGTRDQKDESSDGGDAQQ